MNATWNLTTHIRLDERGVAYIDNTRFKVKQLVLARQAHGLSPEDMVREYSNALTLAQIHAAFAFYYDNKEALDAQLAKDYEEAERMRLENEKTPEHQQLIEKVKRYKQGLAQ
jgi:uncharacterized protein (DUF433 family)